jgi:uncharacterized RmlC-like cupin family protein
MKDNIQRTDYGYEIIWADTDTYCGKILVFESKGGKLPLHFHKTKNKSWFVNSGTFNVRWINTVEGKVYEQELPEGSTFTIPSLMPVMLESLSDNGAIAEASDKSQIDDFYRLG